VALVEEMMQMNSFSEVEVLAISSAVRRFGEFSHTDWKAGDVEFCVPDAEVAAILGWPSFDSIFGKMRFRLTHRGDHFYLALPNAFLFMFWMFGRKKFLLQVQDAFPQVEVV
jgi:hypothetical protein